MPFLCGVGFDDCPEVLGLVFHEAVVSGLADVVVPVEHFVVLAIHVSLEILTNLANIFPVLGVLLVSARPAHDDRTSHF